MSFVVGVIGQPIDGGHVDTSSTSWRWHPTSGVSRCDAVEVLAEEVRIVRVVEIAVHSGQIAAADRGSEIEIVLLERDMHLEPGAAPEIARFADPLRKFSMYESAAARALAFLVAVALELLTDVAPSIERLAIVNWRVGGGHIVGKLGADEISAGRKIECVLVIREPGGHVEARFRVGDHEVHVGRDGVVGRARGVHGERDRSGVGEREIGADVAVLVERPIAGAAAARAVREAAAE